MCYELKTQAGGIEAVIDDNCGISKFYAIANTLSDQLKIKFLNQIDDCDTLDWDFKYKEQYLTLHYSIFNGVSIFPQGRAQIIRTSNAVKEVAKFLQKRIF